MALISGLKEETASMVVGLFAREQEDALVLGEIMISLEAVNLVDCTVVDAEMVKGFAAAAVAVV